MSKLIGGGLIVGSCLVTASTVPAQGLSEDVSKWPAARCQLPHVVEMLKLDRSYANANLASQILPALNEIEQIANTAKISNKPLSEQLSSDQIQKFGELRQRIVAMNLLRLIESKRERDLDVLLRMGNLADSWYRWDTKPKEGTEDHKIYAYMQVVRAVAKDRKQFSFGAFSLCSFDAAIDLIAAEPLARLNKMPLDAATDELNKLSIKYKMKPLQKEKLSKGDRVIYDTSVNDVIEPARRLADYLQVLDDIKLMNRASVMIHKHGLTDAANSGGDWKVVGSTIGAMNARKQIDEQTSLAIGIWGHINDDIPAPILKEFEELSKAQARK